MQQSIFLPPLKHIGCLGHQRIVECVRDLFTENIGDGSGFPLKPAPDAFLHFLGKHGINTTDAFMVGDNYTDIEAAANAGIRSVFCTYGCGKKREQQAFYDAADLSQVTDFILKTSGNMPLK